MTDLSRYDYSSDEAAHTSSYLLEPVWKILAGNEGRSIFEVGCGNGATAKLLAERGYAVTGVDPSVDGIRRANSPALRIGSAYDDLAAQYGTFPIVLSLEVVEHCFDPRRYAKTVYELVAPGGVAIISTPFHGYWKNLALALAGKMDSHYSPLWDGGHIKFWSEPTLRELLLEAGFADVSFRRAGRIAALAKSMIAVARKPGVG